MNSIKILAVGDFGTSHPEKVVIGNKLKEKIKSADIRIINFEGCLHNGHLISATGKSIPQSDNSPKWCVDNGFNLISLANNHTMDYGEEGLFATKRAFEIIDPQINIIGAGSWRDVFKLQIINCNNKKIGFFAATSADFSALKSKWDDKDRFGCAWVNSSDFTLTVANAKHECDYLVLIVHAGVEHLNYPLPEWRERYRELISLGADAIIASHPHVPQGYEVYKDKPIFYSLGNFHFQGSTKEGDSLPNKWRNSISVMLSLNEDGIKAEYYPILTSNGIIEIDQSPEAGLYIEKLSDILSNDVKYMQIVDSEIVTFGHKYLDWFLDGMNAVIMKRDLRTMVSIFRKLLKGQQKTAVSIHQLREESSRLALIRTLKKDLPNHL